MKDIALCSIYNIETYYVLHKNYQSIASLGIQINANVATSHLWKKICTCHKSVNSQKNDKVSIIHGQSLLKYGGRSYTLEHLRGMVAQLVLDQKILHISDYRSIILVYKPYKR